MTGFIPEGIDRRHRHSSRVGTKVATDSLAIYTSLCRRKQIGMCAAEYDERVTVCKNVDVC